MKKLLMILFATAALFLISSIGQGAGDGNDTDIIIYEDWGVKVHWYDPEIEGRFSMTIDIDDSTWPLSGTVTSQYGNTGTIVVERDGGMSWDFDQVAFYDGTWLNRTTATGTMYNIYGNYGDWQARRLGKGESDLFESTYDSILGLGFIE